MLLLLLSVNINHMIINKKRIGIIIFTFIIIFIVILFIKIYSKNNNVVVDAAPNNLSTTSSASYNIATSTNTTTSTKVITKITQEPIAGALTRVTKKPFGIYVSPGHSPVSPERFSGYHTGVDFETTAAEQNIDIPIYALCDGNLLI